MNSRKALRWHLERTRRIDRYRRGCCNQAPDQFNRSNTLKLPVSACVSVCLSVALNWNRIKNRAESRNGASFINEQENSRWMNFRSNMAMTTFASLVAPTNRQTTRARHTTFICLFSFSCFYISSRTHIYIYVSRIFFSSFRLVFHQLESSFHIIVLQTGILDNADGIHDCFLAIGYKIEVASLVCIA